MKVYDGSSMVYVYSYLYVIIEFFFLMEIINFISICKKCIYGDGIYYSIIYGDFI